jgi:putative transcriptional regulator
MSKRKIFDEIMEGVRAMKSHREGKITLRTYNVEAAPAFELRSKTQRRDVSSSVSNPLV